MVAPCVKRQSAPCVKRQSRAQCQQKHLQLWRHPVKWCSKSRRAVSRASAHRGRTLTVLKQRMSWSTIAGVPTRSQPTCQGKSTLHHPLIVLSWVHTPHTMHRLLQACEHLYSLYKVSQQAEAPACASRAPCVSAHCCNMLCAQCTAIFKQSARPARHNCSCAPPNLAREQGSALAGQRKCRVASHHASRNERRLPADVRSQHVISDRCEACRGAHRLMEARHI